MPSAQLDIPRSEVWSMLADYRRWPEFVFDWRRVNSGPEILVDGAVFSFKGVIPGIKVYFNVVDFREGELLAVREQSGAGKATDRVHVFHLEDASEGSTLITGTMTTSFRRLASKALSSPAIAAMGKRRPPLFTRFVKHAKKEWSRR